MTFGKMPNDVGDKPSEEVRENEDYKRNAMDGNDRSEAIGSCKDDTREK